ncbi:hypothetical protein SAMN02746041_01176 [Desulfacinum hydrothermale DSM 13146]|uniref:Tetratricopeptide repeat-containing protein n=1 Tax=Desulfacinum hydrothermale DSM 13146 TaxID=1121390 RepID=A0A1W1XBA0_9BACT|nr:hypothetical protein [Desulfacinum hydrothermale]SMC21315.1 hypothetical protein SAMN02746041_01176 [Desulfacinum hydrothermale DSM 13146]
MNGTFRNIGTGVVMCALVAAMAGCAPRTMVSLPGPWTPAPRRPAVEAPRGPATTPAQRGEIREEDIEAPETGTAAKPSEPAGPQVVASLRLVEEGDRALATGDAEGALALYEQAVQVDGYNGRAFLGLAKAWRLKGFASRSLEFARKAEILLQHDPARLKETYLLEADLCRRLGDAAMEAAYRRKAQRLP